MCIWPVPLIYKQTHMNGLVWLEQAKLFEDPLVVGFCWFVCLLEQELVLSTFSLSKKINKKAQTSGISQMSTYIHVYLYT